jgi:hypothetical protein
MSAKVWMSSVKDNYQLGDRIGIRDKFFGEDWYPADDVIPTATEKMLDAMRRSGRGFALTREDFPEATAVWDEKKFKKVKDLFCSGGFFVVRGKLAEILSRFDLGEGGLVPFPVYKADLVTPNGDDFFLLNFGARKNTLVPEASPNVVQRGLNKKPTQCIGKSKTIWRGRSL